MNRKRCQEDNNIINNDVNNSVGGGGEANCSRPDIYNYRIKNFFEKTKKYEYFKCMMHEVFPEQIHLYHSHIMIYLFSCIKFERDYLYTPSGIKLLCDRYLYKNQPDLIQYCFMRAACLLTGDSEDFELTAILYHAISMGYIHISTVYAMQNLTKRSDMLNVGESCCLMVSESHDDGPALVRQLTKIITYSSHGVGIGYGVENLLLNGSKQEDGLKNGLHALTDALGASMNLSITPRRSNITFYIPIYHDGFETVIELKRPSAIKHDTIFVGLLIPDYFMTILQQKRKWYFFPGDANINGRTLQNCLSCEDFVTLYEEMVALKKYSKSMKSTTVMSIIIKSICHYGSPYIVWIDKVNRYNNISHLGKIKTLNLCSEICNFSSNRTTSTCSILSVNCARFPNVKVGDFGSGSDDGGDINYDYVERRGSTNSSGGSSIISNNSVLCSDDEDDNSDSVIFNKIKNFIDSNYNPPKYDYSHPSNKNITKLGEYMYYISYLATIGLNNVLGSAKLDREIGVTPLGLYDAFMLCSKYECGKLVFPDLLEVTNVMSEFLYKGAIQSSCDYFKRTKTLCYHFPGSQFSRGKPQWMLRGLNTEYDYLDSDVKLLSKSWGALCEEMKIGMSNSMLTCQAPTSSTSLLMNVSASVVLPPTNELVNESNINRTYSEIYAKRKLIDLYGDDIVIPTIHPASLIDNQLDVYKVSAYFIDHAQSAMYFINLSDKQKIFDTIKDSYIKDLKVGLYYFLPLNTKQTLKLVNDDSTLLVDNQSKVTTLCVPSSTTCDFCSM